ncbi:MAG TPA: hypothetical protein VNT75_03600 [Symbiobacteriaceae bacterium]|nr:hypothetical protein [Symbiobacteriaceae bacterium]
MGTKLMAMRMAYDMSRAKKGGAEAVTARQQRRLADLVAYARRHSRFYGEKYQHLPEQVTDLRQLPVVTKRELMNRFEDWVTDPEITRKGVEAFVADLQNVGRDYLGRYAVWTTSGSTGTPAILIHDQKSLAVMTAMSLVHGAYTMQEMLAIFRQGARIAGVYATGGHYYGYAMIRRRVLEEPRKAKSFKIFSVLEPLPELVKSLNELRPAMLGGYASALQVLAQEQKAGRLNIHPVLVNNGGEYLSPGARAEIEAAFGAKVLNNYSCSEAATMGFDCGHGWMHVPADWVILEPVDEHYQPVPAGQMSHSVLVTYLGNRVQPVIRYEVTDRVMVNPEPCACGSSLPAIRVEGRTDDTLSLAGAGGAPVRVLPLAFLAVVKETPGVKGYQVIQTGPAALRLRLETKPGADRAAVWGAVRERMASFLAHQGAAACELSLDSELPAADPKSGKFRHVMVAM